MDYCYQHTLELIIGDWFRIFPPISLKMTRNPIYERITGSDSVEGYDQACHRGGLLHPDSLQHRTSHEQCTEEVGLRHQGVEGKQHEDQRQKAEGKDCSFSKDPPLHTKWKIKTIMQTRSS